METVATMGDMLMRQYPAKQNLTGRVRKKAMGGLSIGPGSPPSGHPQPRPRGPMGSGVALG